MTGDVRRRPKGVEQIRPDFGIAEKACVATTAKIVLVTIDEISKLASTAPESIRPQLKPLTQALARVTVDWALQWPIEP